MSCLAPLECLSSLSFPAQGGGFTLPEIRSAAQRYLVFDIEAVQEHSQAFELRLFALEDKPRFVFRFGVLGSFPARICVDLSWLDGHILFPGHTPGMLKTVCHGSRIAREEISRAQFVSCACHHDVKVTLRHLSLMDSRPAALPLPGRKMTDGMGQLKEKRWRGKTDSLASMKDDLNRLNVQCYDQFALGRFDGENYNIGLFDVCLKPHMAFARLAKACHGTVYRVKAGRLKPAQRKPATIPMIAY